MNSTGTALKTRNEGTGEIGEETRAFIRALSRFIRVIQFRDRDRACCHGLSVSQCYALEAICREKTPSVNDMAARLYLDKSTASRIVSGLEGLGLVTKVPDPEDGRARRLRATEEGARSHAEIETELTAEYERLRAEETPEGRRGLVAVLERLGDLASRRVEAEGGACTVNR